MLSIVISTFSELANLPVWEDTCTEGILFMRVAGLSAPKQENQAKSVVEMI